jgi:ABC-type glycerol-3-phosphate transport system substrate-binding protein
MLAGCGLVAKGGSGAAAGSKSLTIAIQGTNADAKARQGLVQGFMKKYPGTSVTVQPVQSSDWNDFFSKILTQIAGGNSPDLIYLGTEGSQLFASDLGMRLDDYVKQDADELAEYFSDVHPSLIEPMMYKGGLYQLPVEFNAVNMYMNMDVVRKAGLAYPSGDWTKDDFVEFLRAQKRASSNSFVPFYWTNRVWGGIVPWMYAAGGSFLKEERVGGGDWLWSKFYDGDAAAAGRGGGFSWPAVTATDDVNVEVLEFMNEMISEGLTTRPESGGGSTLVGQFAAGSVGTTPAGGFWVGGLHNSGMAADAFDVQYFPKWKVHRTEIGSAGYAILKKSPNPDLAWEFLKYSVSKPAMTTALSGNTTTPARRSMVNEARYSTMGPKHWSVFYDTLDKLEVGPTPAPPQYISVEATLTKQISKALTGNNADVKPALQSMQQQLEKILAR